MLEHNTQPRFEMHALCMIPLVINLALQHWMGAASTLIKPLAILSLLLTAAKWKLEDISILKLHFSQVYTYIVKLWSSSHVGIHIKLLKNNRSLT